MARVHICALTGMHMKLQAWASHFSDVGCIWVVFCVQNLYLCKDISIRDLLEIHLSVVAPFNVIETNMHQEFSFFFCYCQIKWAVSLFPGEGLEIF